MSASVKRLLAPLAKTWKSYETAIALKYPRAYQVYATLKNGSSQFGRETLQFLNIKQQMLRSAAHVPTMSLTDVEVFRQVNKLFFLYRNFNRSRSNLCKDSKRLEKSGACNDNRRVPVRQLCYSADRVNLFPVLMVLLFLTRLILVTFKIHESGQAVVSALLVHRAVSQVQRGHSC
jgi:hypothetical protein